MTDGEWYVYMTIWEPAGSARTTVALQGEERGDVAIDDGTRQIVESGTVSDGRLLVGISGATGHLNALTLTPAQIGRASCRERAEPSADAAPQRERERHRSE